MGPNPDDVTGADDFSLVRAARHGDRLAFGVLYLRHHAAAWRIACVVSRFSPDAEVAVIEAFTRLFSALPEEAEQFGTGAVTLRPYVLACARQAALDRAGAAGRSEGSGASGRSGDETPAAPLAGLGPGGEVVLSSLEHHVARGALGALPERPRTALWLFDVEAMTPAEVAGIIGGHLDEAVALAGTARAEVRAAQQATFGRHEVRAGCRFTVEHLDAYRAAALDHTDGVIVRSHLDRCPPCRMRYGEMADAPATLAAAVPAAPLLGGETQQQWLASAADVRPADRLLPPGVAAAAAGVRPGPARRIPDVLRRAGRAAARSWRAPGEAVDIRTGTSTAASAEPASAAGGWAGGPGRSAAGFEASAGATARPATDAGSAAATPDADADPGWADAVRWVGSFTPPLPPAWTVPPVLAAVAADPAGAGLAGAGLAGAGRAGRDGVRTELAGVVAGIRNRGFGSAVTAVGLVAAWILVMLAVPWLMTPGTAPGPDGLALPAVQAYVDGLLPDTPATRSAPAPVTEPFFPAGGLAPTERGVSAPPPSTGDPAPDAATAGDGGPLHVSVAALHVSAAPAGDRDHGTDAVAPALDRGTGGPAPAVSAIPPATIVPVSVAPAVVPVSVGVAPESAPANGATPATKVGIASKGAGSAGPGMAPGSGGRTGKPAREGNSGRTANRPGTAAALPEQPAPATATARRPGRRPNARRNRTVSA